MVFQKKITHITKNVNEWPLVEISRENHCHKFSDLKRTFEAGIIICAQSKRWKPNSSPFSFFMLAIPTFPSSSSSSHSLKPSNNWPPSSSSIPPKASMGKMGEWGTACSVRPVLSGGSKTFGASRKYSFSTLEFFEQSGKEKPLCKRTRGGEGLILCEFAVIMVLNIREMVALYIPH